MGFVKRIEFCVMHKISTGMVVRWVSPFCNTLQGRHGGQLDVVVSEPGTGT